VVKKYPLLRGKFRNNSVEVKSYIVPLSQLESAKDEVTIDYLIKNNLVPSDAEKIGVKVLLDKAIHSAITLAVAASASAREAVAKAGGTVK
jgi:ribosomal protein L15